MARTAPVPNIPAIPGMNPGVFVMGGGAGGGGSGGKRGNGAGGRQGGRGRNGGRGAEGAGRSACGRRGSCVPTHPGNRGPASRGDPVDVLGGRTFVEGDPDLALPGPLPFVLARSYSSDRAMVDVGLGHGWSHSFAWSARIGRRAVEVTDAEGARLLLPVPGVGEALLGAGGWVVRREAAKELELVREDGLRLVFSAPLDGDALGLSRCSTATATGSRWSTSAACSPRSRTAPGARSSCGATGRGASLPSGPPRERGDAHLRRAR
jgi:hypothetical protein